MTDVVRQRKLVRLCTLMRVACATFVALLAALLVTTWIWPDLVLWAHPFVLNLRLSGVPLNAASALSTGERLAVGALGLPSLAALAWAFYRLDRLLRDFARSQFFERATVGHLRAFAGWLLVAKALSLVALHLRVAALAQFLGPRHVHAVVNLSTDDVAVLLICALLFVIAHMMEAGRDLAEENRGFV